MNRVRLFLDTGNLALHLPEKVPAGVRIAIALSGWKPCLYAFSAKADDYRLAPLRSVCGFVPVLTLTETPLAS